MAADHHTRRILVVYALIASDERFIRYIGQTVLGAQGRLSMHRHSARRRPRTPVHKWMGAVMSRGAQVGIIILDADAVLHETERRLIAWYRKRGLPLLNLTDGGEGTPGLPGPRGKKPWVTERNRQNAGKPGRPRYPGETEALMAYVRGAKRPWLSERNRTNAGKPGKPHTAEAKAKIAAANMGHPVSAETRARIGAANRGRVKTPEEVAKWLATIRENKRQKEGGFNG